MKLLRLLLLLLLSGSLSGCGGGQNPYPAIQQEWYESGLSRDPTHNPNFALPPSSNNPGNPNAYHPRYDADDY
ncbi:MAG: hypothetical protein PW734_03640 [Verrucomicrobium sp.]|nr:hypothetical protein [Verrucomicrobium sp.]